MLMVLVIIGYRAIARRRFGDWEKRKCRNSYRRDSKHHVKRDFGREFEWRRKMLKGLG